ncbi:MAG: PEP-CTERM sorting domain-containing protein [Gammaproteobacteria bacterium]|jgi:predicted extracellular nuclease
MKNIRFLMSVSLLFVATSANSSLMFSEYVEGSSYNKALELFNLGEEVNFDTGNYAIEIYSNGASAASYSINLTGSVLQNSSFLVGHNRSNASILSMANQVSGSLNFNGDDAITLLHNGLVIDTIGQVGVDPGSEWGSGLASTQNNTLRRLPDILLGDNNGFDNFNPALQWSGYAQDSFDGLGEHQINQALPELEPVTSVPEPGSLWLLLLGMLGFLKIRALRLFQANLNLKQFKSLPMNLSRRIVL